MLSRANIAFVWTEFQQSILLSLCLQEKIHIDTIFIRENLPLHPLLKQYTDKIIFLDNIPFSVRSIIKFYIEYKKKIMPELKYFKQYRVFTWNINTPFVKYAINNNNCIAVDLFEDGTESYINWGFCNLRLGIKVFLTTCVISMSTRILSKRKKSLKLTLVTSWTLFENAFPSLNIKKKKLSHEYFRRIIIKSYDKENCVELDDNTIVFLQSAYIESNLLNQEEYIDIHIDAVNKIKNKKRTDDITILWKIHPRTNIEEEKKRIRKISKATGVKIKIIKERISIEFMSTYNYDKNIEYYSLGSTALYTIAALTSKYYNIFLISNHFIVKKFPLQRELNELFISFGIKKI